MCKKIQGFWSWKLVKAIYFFYSWLWGVSSDGWEVNFPAILEDYALPHCGPWHEVQNKVSTNTTLLHLDQVWPLPGTISLDKLAQLARPDEKIQQGTFKRSLSLKGFKKSFKKIPKCTNKRIKKVI